MYQTIRRNVLLTLARLMVWIGDAGRRIERAEKIHDDAFAEIDPDSDLAKFSSRCQRVSKLTGKARKAAANRLMTYCHTQGNPLSLQRVLHAVLADAF